MTGLRGVDPEDMNCVDALPSTFSPVTEANRLIRRDAEHAAWRFCSGCKVVAACHEEAQLIRADNLVMAGRYWTIRSNRQQSIPLLPDRLIEGEAA